MTTVNLSTTSTASNNPAISMPINTSSQLFSSSGNKTMATSAATSGTILCKASLQALPNEILRCINDHLSDSSKISLSLTSRRFNNFRKALSPKPVSLLTPDHDNCESEDCQCNKTIATKLKVWMGPEYIYMRNYPEAFLRKATFGIGMVSTPSKMKLLIGLDRRYRIKGEFDKWLKTGARRYYPPMPSIHNKSFEQWTEEFKAYFMDVQLNHGGWSWGGRSSSKFPSLRWDRGLATAI